MDLNKEMNNILIKNNFDPLDYNHLTFEEMVVKPELEKIKKLIEEKIEEWYCDNAIIKR